MDIIKKNLTEQEKMLIGDTLSSPGFSLIIKCVESKIFYKYYDAYKIMLNTNDGDNLKPIKEITDDVKRYKDFIDIVQEIKKGDVYFIDFYK